LKLRIFIFILGILSAGLAFAEENDTLSSWASTAVEAGSNLGYTNDQMTARAIGERSIDLLGLFDSADGAQSSRYSVKLDVENEDTDWSFEVTISVEF
jgi:hypothetical protein